MKKTYTTEGVCAREISFEIIDGKVRNVEFLAGCGGNLAGIARLVDGMKVEDVIEKVKGIPCGVKASSCPDQLAKALEKTQKL